MTVWLYPSSGMVGAELELRIRLYKTLTFIINQISVDCLLDGFKVAPKCFFYPEIGKLANFELIFHD